MKNENQKGERERESQRGSNKSWFTDAQRVVMAAAETVAVAVAISQ